MSFPWSAECQCYCLLASRPPQGYLEGSRLKPRPSASQPRDGIAIDSMGQDGRDDGGRTADDPKRRGARLK